MPECIHDCLFLLRWTCMDHSFTRSDFIVLPLLKPGLVLYQSNVQLGYIEAILIENPLLDVLICRLCQRNISALIKRNSLQSTGYSLD